MSEELNLEEIETEIDEENQPAEDLFDSTVDDLDSFDNKSWNKGEGYKTPNFPEMEEKLEGWDSGMYLFAAESNVGKSAAMMNIQYDMCTYAPNKLFGLYYTLDDGKNEIIPRVIAMDQSIPISVASKPQRYQTLIDAGEEYASIYEDMLKKRTEGLQKLKDYCNMFKIVDGNKIKSAEDLIAHAKQAQLYVKSIDPEMNIVIAVDSVNDLRFSTKYFGNTADKHSEIAKTVKDWSVELDCIVMGSCHLRKMNANRRPTLDDLKESGEYVYESSVVFLLYNDVSKNKEAAKLYYSQDGIPEKRPVIEFDWAKNKKSSFKGRSYNYFTPEYSKMAECSKEVMRRFDSLVYAS
jgi:replicative DNA helicase